MNSFFKFHIPSISIKVFKMIVGQYEANIHLILVFIWPWYEDEIESLIHNMQLFVQLLSHLSTNELAKFEF